MTRRIARAVPVTLLFAFGMLLVQACSQSPLVTFGNFVGGMSSGNVCTLGGHPSQVPVVCNVPGTDANNMPLSLAGGGVSCGAYSCYAGPAYDAIASGKALVEVYLGLGDDPPGLECQVYDFNTFSGYINCLTPANNQECRMFGQSCKDVTTGATAADFCCQPLVCGIGSGEPSGQCCKRWGADCADDSECCAIEGSVCGTPGGADGTSAANANKCCLSPGRACVPELASVCCSGVCYAQPGTVGVCDDNTDERHVVDAEGDL